MMTANRTYLLMTGMLLAACQSLPAGAPAPRTPAVAEVSWSRFAATLARDGTVQPLAERIADPQLRALIETARAGNPDLALARARIAEARALSASDLSRFAPRMGAEGSVTASRQSESGLLPAGQIPGFETEQVLYSAGFDAAWEVDLFGRRSLVEEIGAYGIDSERFALRAAEASLVADIIRAYIETGAARQELSLLNDIVAYQASLAETTRLKRDQGEASDLDVERAEADLTVQEARRPQAAEGAALAELRLAVLTGTPPSAFRLKAQNSDDPVFISETFLAGTTSDVLRRRPDVRGAELTYASAAAALDLEALNIFPTISLSATAGPETTAFSDFFDPASLAASLTGMVDWALFEGGARVAAREAASARQEQAEARYRATVLGALEEVEAAAVSLQRLRAELDQQRSLSARRDRIAGMAQLRYDGGTGDLVPLLEARRDAVEAQLAVARLTAQVKVQQVALEKALGSVLPAAEQSGGGGSGHP